MKKILNAAAVALVAVSALGVAAPAVAQAPAAAAQAPAPAAATPTYSSKTPVEKLMTNPATRPIMDKHFPDLEDNPLYDSLKGMSLRQIQPMAGGTITDEQLDKLDADLAKVK